MGIQYQGSAGAVFGPAGANHSQGMVTDPGSTADSSTTHRFLRSDATWNQVDYASVTGTPAIPTVNYVLLNTLTASSSATLSDTSSLTATYSSYDIVFLELIPATGLTTLELQVHSGGAFKNTGYLGATTSTTSGATGIANATTFIQCSRAATVQTGSGVSGRISVYNPSSAATPVLWAGQFTHADGTVFALVQTSGAWNTAAVVDGFQVLFSSGNIASGVIKIYGIT